MDDKRSESVLKVCKILNKHSVEFLIVGGTAIAWHGYERETRDSSGALADKVDIDFWYNSTYPNYFKLLNALEELGQDVSEFRAEVAPNPKKSFFRIERDLFTLDFLPELPGLSGFRKSYQNKNITSIDDVPITIISYDDLILNKEALERPKDKEDIKELKKRRSSLPGE